MGRHSKNLKIEMHEKINSQLRIGQSKHEAKAEYRAQCNERGEKWNPSKAEGIYSIKTADKYRQTTNEFCRWCKQEHPAIKKIDQLTKEIAYEYLKQRQSEGRSAYTLSTDMSALNKIANLKLEKSEGGLIERKLENITRSRNSANMDAHVNLDNYKEQVLMATAFGCRRESIEGGKYQLKEEVSLYQNKNGEIYCRMIEKGGKYREAPCRDDLKSDILNTFNVRLGEPMNKPEFVKVYNSRQNDYMFNNYSKNIDNHAFRAEYATVLYRQLVEKYPASERKLGYNAKAAAEVSQALGHTRLSVLKHYVRER